MESEYARFVSFLRFECRIISRISVFPARIQSPPGRVPVAISLIRCVRNERSHAETPLGRLVYAQGLANRA
ncbi:hypothetical protein I6G56_03195 [Burkholderia humptydooensis]|uniref:Uncharacterized protein n=1 Tax=Burkholderia humptydooensis TaxID=430531 RepID=A0A7T2WYW6_9BURK|nr:MULTISPECIES: hypothetical protein [Burkholderia]QPS44128.1 hypothetical protein I6G56_03195 [Burkholderia humptydooensis]